MLDKLDHVGYLARDLEGAVGEFCARLGIENVRRFERPQLGLLGAYIGAGSGSIEIFSFTDPELQEEILGSHEVLLDHVAFEVEDIAATEASMRSTGVRFCKPDQREKLSEPIELGGILHLWTRRETTCGQSMQLLQRPTTQR